MKNLACVNHKNEYVTSLGLCTPLPHTNTGKREQRLNVSDFCSSVVNKHFLLKYDPVTLVKQFAVFRNSSSSFLGNTRNCLPHDWTDCSKTHNHRHFTFVFVFSMQVNTIRTRLQNPPASMRMFNTQFINSSIPFKKIYVMQW